VRRQPHGGKHAWQHRSYARVHNACATRIVTLPNNRVYHYEAFAPTFEIVESSEITDTAKGYVSATCTRPQRRMYQLTPVCSAATNATDSYFLRLPAEIRERIYSLTLGGRVLHVASGPIHRPHSVVVCAHADDYDEGPAWIISRFETQITCRTLGNGESHAFLGSHERCYNLPPRQRHLPVQLLQVCRKIYHEGKCLTSY
jgi:hypothetical protein